MRRRFLDGDAIHVGREARLPERGRAVDRLHLMAPAIEQLETRGGETLVQTVDEDVVRNIERGIVPRVEFDRAGDRLRFAGQLP